MSCYFFILSKKYIAQLTFILFFDIFNESTRCTPLIDAPIVPKSLLFIDANYISSGKPSHHCLYFHAYHKYVVICTLLLILYSYSIFLLRLKIVEYLLQCFQPFRNVVDSFYQFSSHAHRFHLVEKSKQRFTLKYQCKLIGTYSYSKKICLTETGI